MKSLPGPSVLCLLLTIIAGDRAHAASTWPVEAPSLQEIVEHGAGPSRPRIADLTAEAPARALVDKWINAGIRQTLKFTSSPDPRGLCDLPGGTLAEARLQGDVRLILLHASHLSDLSQVLIAPRLADLLTLAEKLEDACRRGRYPLAYSEVVKDLETSLLGLKLELLRLGEWTGP